MQGSPGAAAGGAAARACVAPATTDEAMARATAGREEAAVSTVWREGGAVAAPDSITDEFFCYDYWTTVASGAVENASPDSATAHFRRPVRQMWRPGLDSAA
jgi:hypothetical protein